MRRSSLIVVSALILSTTPLIGSQDVIFPGYGPALGSSCRNPSGASGVCMTLESCPYALDRYASQPVSHCFVEGLTVVICCPVLKGVSPATPVSPEGPANLVEIVRPVRPVRPVKPLHTSSVNPQSIVDISAPNITQFECGDFASISVLRLCSDPYIYNNQLLDIQEQGFEVIEVTYRGNIVTSFVWTDGENEYPEQRCGQALNGEAARRAVAQYMALLGRNNSQGNPDDIPWFCDGILINERWVLTAAHCVQSREVEVVRLGEYDYNDINDHSQPEDFGVAEVVMHPQFKPPVAYHDLALLKLNRRVRFSRFINPICLPWGNLGKQNLVGNQITLTGWGAIVPGGPGVSLLQEVNVTVFKTSVCNTGYSSLPFYSTLWPSGIAEGTLCAGGDGKDACQGDSGGPVVFFIEDESADHRSRYMLAGVVSKGHGCGTDEFPGLYMDIKYGQYLSWIKNVAFSGN